MTVAVKQRPQREHHVAVGLKKMFSRCDRLRAAMEELDRRIRAEAFDLVLQTGAAGGAGATASTDYLWLTRPV